MQPYVVVRYLLISLSIPVLHPDTAADIPFRGLYILYPCSFLVAPASPREPVGVLAHCTSSANSKGQEPLAARPHNNQHRRPLNLTATMDTNMEDVKMPEPMQLSSAPASEPTTIPTLDGWIESLMSCKQLAESDVQRLCDKVCDSHYYI